MDAKVNRKRETKFKKINKMLFCNFILKFSNSFFI